MVYSYKFTSTDWDVYGAVLDVNGVLTRVSSSINTNTASHIKIGTGINAFHVNIASRGSAGGSNTGYGIVLADHAPNPDASCSPCMKATAAVGSTPGQPAATASASRPVVKRESAAA